MGADWARTLAGTELFFERVWTDVYKDARKIVCKKKYIYEKNQCEWWFIYMGANGFFFWLIIIIISFMRRKIKLNEKKQRNKRVKKLSWIE
jgi:hypothetical protein